MVARRSKKVVQQSLGRISSNRRAQRRRRHDMLRLVSFCIASLAILVIVSLLLDFYSSSSSNNTRTDIVTLLEKENTVKAKREHQPSKVQQQQQQKEHKQEPPVEAELHAQQIQKEQKQNITQQAGAITRTERVKNETTPSALVRNEQARNQLDHLREDDDDNDDADCPFRDSPIYRKVYVYPNYGDVENGWSGSILSDAGRKLSTLEPWPWLEFDRMARHNATSHYDIKSTHVQYATELLVREVMTNPKSCLRTFDPEEATLFYVPYLPSVEHHKASVRINDYTTSPYGQAILDILDKGEYGAWEERFGLVSEYWKRRNGSDHILVFSEPMHGLWHPKLKRGNFHYIHSQKQLHPPIVISVELSTTFVNMYPNCAAKNILMPYPNTDGRWFNGFFVKEVAKLLLQNNNNKTNFTAAIPAEKDLAGGQGRRPAAQYFQVGLHGTCTKLRKAMTSDYMCSSSSRFLQEQLMAAVPQAERHAVGMSLSTFCPCPGGDSPSAKRMFDSIFMGCIPIVISADFVWPFTKESDPLMLTSTATALDPKDFSLRFSASEYNTVALDPETCKAINETQNPGLQARLDAISASEIQRLRQGLRKARDLYSWYRQADGESNNNNNNNLVDNPLREAVLPDGGAAHALVNALAKRAAGAKWPACEQELKLNPPEKRENAKRFKC